MSDNYNENRETCKRIAEELEAYAENRVYICPECGERIAVDEDNDAEEIACSCGETFDRDDAEIAYIMDAFEDCYDIEYTIGSDGTFRAVRIMVACGGPNIYVNTKTAEVELYWWNESAMYPISYETRDAINDCFEDIYACTR